MMMRLLSTTYLLAAQVLLFLPASIKKVEGADGHVTPSELRELLRLERRLLNLSCCHDKLDEARQELEELLQPSDVDPTVHPLKGKLEEKLDKNSDTVHFLFILC